MIFRLLQYIVQLIFKLLFRLEGFGLENVPTSGPLLVVSNHASNLDPFLCGNYIFFKRDIHFLAKRELFNNKLIGWIMSTLNAHPIKRGHVDRRAIALIFQLLKEEKAVLIFPEGTRSNDGKLKAGKAGVGYLICQAKVPVLPLYIDNSFAALPRGIILPRFEKIRIFFGKPQYWSSLLDAEPSKETYQQISDRCLEEIEKLIPARE